MGLDQLCNFAHRIDRAFLKIAGPDRSQTLFAGGRNLRRPRSGAFQKQVRSDGLEPLFIDEIRQRDLAQAFRRHAVVEIGEDLAIGVDGDAARVFGDGDVRNQRIAVRGDDLPLGRAFQAAIAGIGRDARGHGHLEIAKTVDRHIQIAIGLAERTLTQHDGDGCGAHAEAKLDTGRHHRAIGRGQRPRANRLLILQVGEFGATWIVAGGRHVREVVRNDIDARLLRAHAGCCDLKCSHVLSFHRVSEVMVMRMRWSS